MENLFYVALGMIIAYGLYKAVDLLCRQQSDGQTNKIKFKASLKKDFDSDIKFLNYLIDFYINDFKMTTLNVKNKNISGNNSYALIQEDDLKRFAIDIVYKITSNLSEDYKFVLSFYINDLDDYISSQVINQLILLSSTYNIVQINGINTDYMVEKIRQLNKADTSNKIEI